ncbi:MAG: DUF721 domain-containing protein [Planctomycetota bacterium]
MTGAGDEKGGRRGGPAEKVGKILERVLKEKGLHRPKELTEIDLAWRDVAGPEVSAETVVLGFRAGVLTIEVASAPLLSELTTYQREELLAALRTRWTGTYVQDIRFRIR